MAKRRVKLIPQIEDGLDKNDYRGALGEIDVPDREANHLIDAGRAVAVKEKKKAKPK